MHGIFAPKSKIKPFESDEEEEPSSQEDEAALTPFRHRSKCHDMEREIRQLREDKAAILEELRELKVFYKDMQKLTVKLLAPRQHRVRETPVPLPPTINKPPAGAAPKPVPYTPQTSPSKLQVPPRHLKFREARLIADTFLNSPQPYTDTMTMLNDQYGLPFQLALAKIAEVMDAPNVQTGDTTSFNLFALEIQALVGLLNSLGSQGEGELGCASHAARLLTKLPPDLRAAFKRHLPYHNSYTLPDLAEWLKLESRCQDSENSNQTKEQRTRLRLYKPPFYSTVMDCFGPFQTKIGRRLEKRWGIIFKCLTTRCVHIELLTAIDTDSFLMALRRFIARRGTPSELIYDQGTNFQGGERELRDALKNCSQELQWHLAKQKIEFRFNPPNAPYFGGSWEKEIRSLKNALRTVVGEQTVPEEVLQTVLIEIEGILNSKPSGYVSSNVADLDAITPNHLLMGRLDSSLPQVIYPADESIGRRRWRPSQVLSDHFWSSFVRHYLPNLQLRHKWHAETKTLAVGSVVMIVDPQLPRALWLIGIVSKTFPDVNVKGRLYTRPVTRLINLPEITVEDDTKIKPI
ncbi:hypothetical protein HF521_012907 [Silurus meridionalis]|uniref:Integrase catalytic domain-containing protein n=1 Tax=Silurus meridionalis TaxID=175797 RepID=A0A8T0ABQ8_SILME|nr:hypothetical protein HF521_012907 [Silurus meridionalis]